MSPSGGTWDCTVTQQIQADPDFGGIGIIVAFVITACLALIAACFGLLLDLFDHVERLKSSGPFDKFLHALYRLVPFYITLDARENARHVLHRLMRTISDQQLVLGIALLAAGWLRLNTITVYHFEMMTDLAWLSSSTHLLTVGYLEKTCFRDPRFRDWRVVAMCLNFVLLLVATVYTGHRDWFDLYGVPARCLVDAVSADPRVIGGYPAAMMGLWVAVLVYGYARGIVPLYPRLRTLLTPPFLSKHYPLQRHSRSFLPCKLTTRIALAFRFLASWAWTVLAAQSFWFALGNYAVWTDRLYAQPRLRGDEDVWGFAQLVPLFLLGLALARTAEAWFGEYLSQFALLLGVGKRDLG
ncbi:MAG: hypothetical protein M1833_001863 [Piccolia ochrophora]|nr:MAG: hypothetical protein M1833_001863 [Piccolia ochrophora]